jgi:hypothetical protein
MPRIRGGPATWPDHPHPSPTAEKGQANDLFPAGGGMTAEAACCAAAT